MNELTIQKSERGWIIKLPDDFVKEISVAKGSIAILYGGNGKLETEILPPLSSEIEKTVDRIYDKIQR